MRINEASLPRGSRVERIERGAWSSPGFCSHLLGHGVIVGGLNALEAENETVELACNSQTW